MNSDYKKYLLRQLGITKSQSQPPIVERHIDRHELEMGAEEEAGEHDMSPEKALQTARQHLGEPEQAGYYSGLKVAKKMGMLKDELQPNDITTPRSLNPMGMSPTAKVTPVIALAIRGSNTGGLPSGADQTGISPSTPTGRLGGYEPIPADPVNSKAFDNTPCNPEINSGALRNENPQTINDPHPHQVQKATDEPPQAVTGASTDSDDTLKLKSAVPKGVDIDVAQECGSEEEEEEEEEGKKLDDMDGEESMEDQDKQLQGLQEAKHKAGCQCGFCKNKGSFGKKKKDTAEEGKKEEEDEEKKLDETFKRHSKMAFDRMKLTGTLDSVTEGVGASEPFVTHWKMDKEKAGMVKVDETETKESVEIPKKEGLVRLSEAFEKMKGLANLGERRVMSNGVWLGPQSPKPINEIFNKYSDKQLTTIKEKLEKKSKRGTLGDKEKKLLGKLDEVIKTRIKK